MKAILFSSKTYISLFVLGLIFFFSFKKAEISSLKKIYLADVERLEGALQHLKVTIQQEDVSSEEGKLRVLNYLNETRIYVKNADFWLRYLEPIVYKKINGPLPVEWENEVFEKFEKPYKREGAGLSLAAVYMEEPNFEKDSLIRLIDLAMESCIPYKQDSITRFFKNHHAFFLANRLFLLNLAALYTTGFECPDSERILPELKAMLTHVSMINSAYNETFQDYPLGEMYLKRFKKLETYIASQHQDINRFNHYNFIKDFVNLLFAMNQEMIRKYKIVSENFNDFSLNNKASSIFDKFLYEGQDTKGIYRGIKNDSLLSEIRAFGKLLFYDPILSKNNKRSCVSCHKPKEFFTDTSVTSSLEFDQHTLLSRNTPTLLNADANHLLMLDGKHIDLFGQFKDVIANPKELASTEKEILKKILSCHEYKERLKQFADWTNSKEITFEHISASVILYFSQFSKYTAPFDDAMNNKSILNTQVIDGFNLFMGKAACGTCHFVPLFNGVKPPYIGSEFEVLGVPQTKDFKALSVDQGRYLINPAKETKHAFRTGNLKNIMKTKPFMHNGVFKSMEEVIEFYDAGGGVGKGFQLKNQTLSSDSLKLSDTEKIQLIQFMESLTENIIFDEPPAALPKSKIKALNQRKVGGEY
ncbi:MAG: cytochrome C peroxidase [Saprospiraceae bacterium]|nr:cytochrome C peroxidase [Saprospiraceae bacterium]